jgi:superfamily II DNA or RNA helicase
MVGQCELLMVDEMDNAASGNYDDLFDKWFNGRYIHGFSGTPYDPDKPVEKMILQGRFGPVISKSKRKELEDIGQIQPIRYYMIQFGDIDPKDKTAFDVAERDIIIDNQDFHNMILKITNMYSDGKTLIVVDTSNIEDIGLSLEQIIPQSVFIYNKISQTKRKKAIEDFENGNIKVLIVSKIGKRGMDLGGGAHTQIIIGGGRLRSNFDQIIGRGVRKNDKGYTKVFDFYFTGNKYLLNHSRKRLRFVVDMGYVSNLIYGSKTIEAEKFIKSRYRLPH